jgi:hypothetical protein
MHPVDGYLILYERQPDQLFDGTSLKGNICGAKPVRRISERQNRFVVLLNGQSVLHGITPYLERDNQTPRRLYKIIVKAYSIPCKSYGYWNLAHGKKTTNLKHAIKGSIMLLRHRLSKALFPAKVADQLGNFTPGVVMDRWEFWS